MIEPHQLLAGIVGLTLHELQHHGATPTRVELTFDPEALRHHLTAYTGITTLHGIPVTYPEHPCPGAGDGVAICVTLIGDTPTRSHTSRVAIPAETALLVALEAATPDTP